MAAGDYRDEPVRGGQAEETVMRFIGNVLRALVGIVGLVFGLAGLAALGFLVAAVLAGNGLISQPLGQVWFQHDPFAQFVHTPSLPLFGAIIERRLHPAIWNPGLVTVLGWPAWQGLLAFTLFFGLVSIVLFALARRRR
jgi:hypothetical protein